MAFQKKEKTAAKKPGKRVLQKGQLLLGKAKGYFSFLASPFKYLSEKYRRWPRFLQICSLYLMVLLFAGAIFVWRSAQLRTINPYIENIKFTNPEDDCSSDIDADKQGGGEKEHKGEVNGVGQVAAVEPGSAEDLPAEQPPGSGAVWPLKGELLYSFGDHFKASLGKGQMHSTCKWIGIKAAPGDEVRSILRGTVKEIKNPRFPYGKEIIIEHEGSYKAYYGALQESRVKRGDQVDCGEVIATVSENPEGGETYLYLEIEENGRHVDPASILP